MIRCQALSWGAPGQPLTSPLTLEFESGSLTAIIGANGCGKSSLLKVIAGLQRPLAGKVSLSVPRQSGVSFLPQQQHLDRQFPISLEELVAAGFWGRRLSTQLRAQRLAAALENWHLNGLDQRPLMALSGGELQRALLARLSLTDAPVLLLDEPHAALDELPLSAIINDAEAALGTAVQTAVKRADEQAFALANGQNLMFCEDAARRLNLALRRSPGVSAFKLRVTHAESLHAHDAVAESHWHREQA